MIQNTLPLSKWHNQNKFKQIQLLILCIVDNLISYFCCHNVKKHTFAVGVKDNYRGRYHQKWRKIMSIFLVMYMVILAKGSLKAKINFYWSMVLFERINLQHILYLLIFQCNACSHSLLEKLAQIEQRHSHTFTVNILWVKYPKVKFP